MKGYRRPASRRHRAERWGRIAERLCRWHLRLRGWRIIAADWRCPSGEIDIVARRRGVLAIVEVKSRRRRIAAAAAAPAHRPGHNRLSVDAPGAGGSDAAIRRDAGRAAASAPPSGERVARRRISTTPDTATPELPGSRPNHCRGKEICRFLPVPGRALPARTRRLTFFATAPLLARWREHRTIGAGDSARWGEHVALSS
jgi:hypothetical protein